jgi:putative PIN family toxin of toxin-antitoxin system
MPILKAVIDTSVMVSVAFAVQGLAKELRNMIADGRFLPVTSKPILKELYQVLHYPHIAKRFSPTKEDINAFIALIIERALIVEGLYEINGISADPNDDMFIACALEADADYIISRDPHLRNIKHYRRIQIIDAATFIEKVKGK